MHSVDVAHILGQVGKWLIVLVVYGFSLTMSYMFFLAIAPPDKPWLPIAGLSLTEGGFLVWMFVFRMIKYHPIHKSIALLMTLACAACSLVVAGFEFYGLLAAHFDLLTNPLVAQYVALFLLIIFAAHFVSLIAELLVGEHQKNPFVQRGGQQNLIPVSYYEQQNLIPVHAGGESARPLAQSNQPKEERTFDNTGQLRALAIEQPRPPQKQLPRMRAENRPGYGLGELLKEGASSVMSGARSFTSNGKRAGSAPGKTSQNIEGSS